MEQISKLAALMQNPTIQHVGRAVLVANNPGTGRPNPARTLNDNLQRIMTEVERGNGGTRTTKNLVEQAIENQNTILREVRNGNESDCCEEIISRLGRVEGKIDDLLNPLNPTEDTDNPLPNMAGGLLFCAVLLITKNVVITVFFSMTVGTVGGVINWHIIRLSRKAQKENWAGYPAILLLRMLFTIFNMATTGILLGNLFHNAVTSQPPMSEIPILQEIPLPVLRQIPLGKLIFQRAFLHYARYHNHPIHVFKTPKGVVYQGATLNTGFTDQDD